MQHSESINEIAAALAKAQAAIAGAAKDAKGNYGKYADLQSVWEAIRGPLTASGLSVAQFPALDEEGVRLTTVLMHTSGQWFSSELTMPVDRRNAHGVGSAITYSRRYALAAIVGVAPEDDDGQGAADAPPPEPTAKTQEPAPRTGAREKKADPRAYALAELAKRGIHPDLAASIVNGLMEDHDGKPSNDSWRALVQNIRSGAFDPQTEGKAA